ncbi:MAG: PepSY domain-containing protein [Asticcacaulis sp.]|uniref:PepSY domain-containing protein n=1 Tax=Asticcacaulis sp. TaxID=1872648 RepID=UPI0039E6DBC1
MINAIALTALVAGCGFMVGSYAIAWEPRPHGRPPHDHDRPRDFEQEAIREAVRRGEVISLPKILKIGQKAVEGDILEVELEQESWGLNYELKILTPSGVVRKVDVNAKTGVVVNVRTD